MFVIYDTEYTSWKGCQEKGWIEPQKKEIVQIAALKVEKSSLKVLEEFCCYIRPTYNPVLSDYFSALTGITNDKIEKEGVSFEKADERFAKFAGNLPCYAHGWGDGDKIADGAIFKLNWEYNNLPERKLDFRNIATWFKERYKEHHIDIKSQASGQIIKLLHLEKNESVQGLDEHNALFDVYSILEGIRHFNGEGL